VAIHRGRSAPRSIFYWEMAMTALLDPNLGDRLAKLCGSTHDGERATAAAKADALVRQLGLTWQDVIVLPIGHTRLMVMSPTIADWQKMASLCFARRAYLNPREREFIESMLRWRRKPTERQLDWLIALHARLQSAGADR
jgi:hypothetical protein